MKSRPIKPDSFKERTGYSRINLLSRGEKDRRHLQRAKERVDTGQPSETFTTKTGGLKEGDQIAKDRGSTVRVAAAQKEGIPKKTTVIRTIHEPETTKRIEDKYEPADYNPDKVNRRISTKELGRQLKERPDKTAARMQAQAEKKTTYDYTYPSGKKVTELAGIKTPQYEKVPAKTREKTFDEYEPTTVRTSRTTITNKPDKKEPPEIKRPIGEVRQKYGRQKAKSPLAHITNKERKGYTSHTFKNVSTTGFQNRETNRRNKRKAKVIRGK